MAREINLSSHDAKTALRIMMAEQGVHSFAGIARALDVKETSLRSTITRGSIRLSDFMRIAEHLGYSVIVRGNTEGPST